MNADVRRQRGMRWSALMLLACLGLGIQAGLLESWGLRRGGFLVSADAVVEIAWTHALLGIVLGLVGVLLTLPLRALRSGAWRRWIGLGPVMFTSFMLVGITINVRHLSGKLRPESLAVDAGVLVAVLALAWFWSRRRWGTRGDGIALLIVLLLDCGLVLGSLRGEDEAVDAAPQTATVVDGAPDILLILLDTLRADHMGSYGYHRDTTPHMDALAAEATVFERAYSTSNWTRPAIASLHSSTMPSRHGMIRLDRGLSSSLLLLAQQLRGDGYQTGFFTVGVNIEPEDGYARGVDHFYFAKTRAAVERTPLFHGFVFRFAPRTRALVRQRSDGSDPVSINEQVFQFADGLDPDRPSFFYVHYMGPHAPYSPPAPWDTAFTEIPMRPELANPPDLMAGADALPAADRQQMIAQYDGEILMHDEAVDALLAGLRARGRLADAVVVITADHGEGWGEHGVWEHGRGLFEEIVHVPLIVWSTQDWNQGRRLMVPASLMDLPPTLASLAGGVRPAGWDGADLTPWLRAEREDTDRVVFQENAVHEEKGLRNGDWAYFEGEIDGKLVQWLYSADDTAQEHELSARYPLQLKEFHELVAERSAVDADSGDEAPTVELDAARLERLRALGYIK